MKSFLFWVCVGVTVSLVWFFLRPWLSKIRKSTKFFGLLRNVLQWLLRPLKKSVVWIPLIVLIAGAVLYFCWLQEKLFPENRLEIAVCTFLHNPNDTDEENSWRITKDKIRKGLLELKDEIKLVILDTVVTSEEESREVGKAKGSDLVVWGSFVHIGDLLEVEPHITLLCSLGCLRSMVIEPTTEKFPMSQSFAQPSAIDLVRKKAQEVNDVVLLASGLAKYNSGAFEEAIKFFEKIESKTTTLLILTGNAYFACTPPNFVEAQKVFGQAAMKESANATAYFNWGTALNGLDSLEEAIQKFKMAVALDPGCVGAYNNWGNALRDLGRPGEAIEKFKIAAALDPEISFVYNNWGNALRDLGSLEEALGRGRQALQRREEAIEKYEMAVALDPKYVYAYCNWGATLSELGRYRAAVDKFETAVRINPNHAYAYNNWGNASIGLGEWKKAINKFKMAVRHNLKHAYVYNNWGIALDRSGKHEEAVDKFTTAIAIDPKYAHAYNNRGFALINVGRHEEEAIEDFTRALELDPRLFGAYHGLVSLLVWLNRKGEAKEELNKVRVYFVMQKDEGWIARVDSLLKGL